MFDYFSSDPHHDPLAVASHTLLPQRHQHRCSPNQGAPADPSTAPLPPIDGNFNAYYFGAASQNYFEDDTTTSTDNPTSSSMHWQPMSHLSEEYMGTGAPTSFDHKVLELGYQAHTNQWPNQWNGTPNPTYDLSAPQFSARHDISLAEAAPPPPQPIGFTNRQRIRNQNDLFFPQNDIPVLPGNLTNVERDIPSSQSVPRGPYHCCRRMQKSELSGPLPSVRETDAYLHRELGLAPGTVISLALNKQLRSSDTSITSGSCSPWRSARVACLLAIRGSEHRALTTKEIFEALIKAIPFCGENADLALDPTPRAKRKGWPATVVSVLSKHTIFVQKTPEGRSCKEWRLDVRGEKYQTGSCSHSKKPA